MITKLGIHCQPTYTSEIEENEDFESQWKEPSINGTCFTNDYPYQDVQHKYCPWNHYSAISLSNPSILGKSYTYYAGGGYIAQWDFNSKNAINITRYLQDNYWLDQFTAAVFVEFTVYNPNINLFSYVSLLLEFTPSGNLEPYPAVYTFKLYDYTSSEDIQAITVTLTYVIFVMTLLYFVIKEVDDMKRAGKKYLLSANNWLEICIIISSILVLLGYMVRKVLVDITGRELQDAKDSGNLELFIRLIFLVLYRQFA